MTKVYTKTGDKGHTSLFTGHRVPKNNPYIHALGTIDECNSALGAGISLLPSDQSFKSVKSQLEIIQHALFDIGAQLATPRSMSNNTKISKTRFDQEETEAIEKWIDEMEKELDELHSFILPGGHPASAFFHLARSICRRAEREVVPIVQKADAAESILVYLNRLSDYLFVLSRYVNFLTKSEETLWQHNKLTSTP